MMNLMDLVYQTTEHLAARGLKVSTAESCTGGLVASLLTELPGSSAWFERGFVTYSNLAKIEMLGVDEALINSRGAVSKEVAEAMALGALAHSAADLSLSVTGIAGPGGGSAAKPVGTVWIAWALRDKAVQSVHCHFPDVSRQEFRQLVSARALEGVISLLPLS